MKIQKSYDCIPWYVDPLMEGTKMFVYDTSKIELHVDEKGKRTLVIKK